MGVQIVLAQTELAPVPAHQLDILLRMGVAVAPEPKPAAVILDALIGYSLRGDPAGRAAELITWANYHQVPVLALDTPSGLDVSSGRAGQPCIRATATLTLALPKVGLIGAPEVGELYLGDISVPPSLYRAMGIEVAPLFGGDSIVRLVTQPGRKD